MNVKEKDLVQKALTLAESVGARVESGYWLEESQLGQLPISKRWRDVACGNGVIVAVGYGNGSLNNSENLRGTIAGAWQKINTPEWRWEAVAYGDGVFIAGGSNNIEGGKAYIARSEDGITWDKVQLPASSAFIVDIAYGDGKFLVVTESGNYTFFSDDKGLTWTAGSYNTSGASFFQCVTYCNGYFYIGMNKGWGVYRTENGQTFESAFSGGGGRNDETIMSLSASDNIVLACGYQQSYMYSPYRYIHYDTRTNSSKVVDIDTGDDDVEYAGTVTYGGGSFLITPSNTSIERSATELFSISENTLDAYAHVAAPSKQYWGPTCFCGGKFISMPTRDVSSDKGTTVVGYASSDGSAWTNEFGNYIVDSSGANSTDEVMDALNGIQTNTLDAAYTNGVNAYQGE